MAAAAIWDFQNFEILTVVTAKRAKLRHCAKFYGYWSNCCGDMAIFFDFSNMAVVRHFGFVMRMFRPPTKGIWWSLSLCKIWLDRYSSFDNMQVLIFCEA